MPANALGDTYIYIFYIKKYNVIVGFTYCNYSNKCLFKHGKEQQMFFILLMSYTKVCVFIQPTHKIVSSPD